MGEEQIYYWKIIALMGRSGTDLRSVLERLTLHKNIEEIKRACVGDKGYSSDEFLKKIVSGDIVEASCNEDNKIYGTDVSNKLRDSQIYVCIYEPEQVEILLEDPRLQVLPIFIHQPSKTRLNNLIEWQGPVNASYKFVEDWEKPLDFYLEKMYNLIKINIDKYDMYDYLKAGFLEDEIKTNNSVITNLDNFIQ